MTNKGGHKKIKKLWVFLISGILVFLYSIWWIIVVYVPYCKKRDSLKAQITSLELEIEQRNVGWGNYKRAEARLGASMNSIQAIRSKLPHLKNLEKIVMHLKEKGLDLDLVVEEELPASCLSPSPYPSEILIHPVNLTFGLKGDFETIGKFIQFLDEENQHFCHIRSVNMERSTSQSYTVLAHIKMEIFFQKQGEEDHEIL